jgi:hypothetical protein
MAWVEIIQTVRPRDDNSPGSSCEGWLATMRTRGAARWCDHPGTKAESYAH